MAITAISKAAPQVTNLGPIGGALTVKQVTAISMGVPVGQAYGAIGTVDSLPFGMVASVAASQANVEQARIRLLADCRLNSVTWGVESVTGTSSFDIIDITNGNAQVLAAQALPAAAVGSGEATTFASAAEQVLAKGTVLALRANTAAVSTIANLDVYINVEIIAVPSGQRSYD